MKHRKIIEAEEISQRPETKTRDERLCLIEELCGCTAGETSLCDMLLEDRRRERELELTKDGW